MTWPWFPFVVSAAVTFVAAPVVRRVMLRSGVMDVPNHRSSHTVPTPRGGGLACAAGAIVGNVAAAVVGFGAPWTALIVALALAAVGFLDDRRGLAPLPRLAAQVALGLALGLTLGKPSLVILGVVLFPVMVNTVNFMDGINGISGATITVWGATMVALGAKQGSGPVATLGALAVGMGLGFLPWNAPKARLFLGDVGSYLYGGLVAAGVLVAVNEGVPMLAVVSPLLLYISDVGFTLIRRYRRGDPLTEAHREHTYQQLVAVVGLTHTTVAGIVTLSAVIISFAWIGLDWTLAAPVSVAVITAYVLLPSVIPDQITKDDRCATL